jgi:multidrug efflux pump subunit AcrA (membrane-fusion protein)
MNKTPLYNPGYTEKARDTRPGFALPALAAVFLIALLQGCFLLPKEEKVLTPPLVKPPEISYNTFKVIRDDIELAVLATGYFVSNHQSDVYFKNQGGRLKGLYTQIGDEVAKGALVAELFSENLASQIEQQRINVKKLEINVDRLEDPENSQYTLELALLDVDLAELRLEDLKRAYEEAKVLATLEGEDPDNSRRLKDMASDIQKQEIALTKARMNHERLEREQEDAVALEIAKLDLLSAMIRFQDLERQIEDTRLYAPVAGKVVYIDRNVSEGDYVNAYRNIMRIADPKNLKLEYSGSKYSEFILGQEVEVTIEDVIHTGEVIQTPSSIPYEEREGNLDTIGIRVYNLPAAVELGDSARIRLLQDYAEDTIVIPKSALFKYTTRRYVQVMEEGIKKERDVLVGIETATKVQILEGLSEGEEIILR